MILCHYFTGPTFYTVLLWHRAVWFHLTVLALGLKVMLCCHLLASEVSVGGPNFDPACVSVGCWCQHWTIEGWRGGLIWRGGGRCHRPSVWPLGLAVSMEKHKPQAVVWLISHDYFSLFQLTAPRWNLHKERVDFHCINKIPTKYQFLKDQGMSLNVPLKPEWMSYRVREKRGTNLNEDEG